MMWLSAGDSFLLLLAQQSAERSLARQGSQLREEKLCR